jgi:glycosyltransferase involved in cell wall biosynthesis
MRIAVDGRHLGAGRGVGRYSARLVGALREGFGDEEWQVVERRTRAWYAAGALLGRPRVDRAAGGADVVWLPAPAPVGLSPDVPYVLTVHDLSWVQRPADFGAYERVWHRAARVPRLVAGAARVIAVSAATRDALVERWGNEDKVVVVRSGPGLTVGRDLRNSERDSGPRSFFLVVGAIEPRKEPDVARRAHELARRRGLEAQLRFVGGGVSDEELREAYAGALAVVHPAQLEGFGFPPIEGLLHGAPAIVADLPVYDETIGGGALRFPAGDAGALADAMLTLAGDEALRASLVAQGRAAVAQLSWQRAAEETHAVLREAAR